MKKLFALLALLPLPALGMGEFDGLYECKMPDFDAILYNVVVTSGGQTGIMAAAPVKTKKVFQGHSVGSISDGVFSGISGYGKNMKAEFSGNQFVYESAITDKNGRVIPSTVTCVKSW